MANFRTHVVGAAVPSALLASWLLHAHGLSLPVSAACLVCGSTGGLLPDVDSEESIPTRLVFSTVGALSALLAASAVYQRLGSEYAPLFALATGLLTYVLIRYGLVDLFHAVTKHRGVIHSIPMAAACGLALHHGLSLALSMAASVAMWPGIFLSGGFIVHLLLDELYSVDLRGARLKRSFGTAMKLGSRSNLTGTIGIYAAVIAMVVAMI